MIRLLLKDLRPATYPETSTLHLFHEPLPQALEIRHSLAQALELLPGITSERKPPHCWDTTEMQPRLGTMVGLPPFEKARGMKRCRQQVGPQEMSVERKYDGEYCQVHVYVDQLGHHDITMFSKSGRVSTKDRESLHSTIEACLQLNTSDCQV